MRATGVAILITVAELAGLLKNKHAGAGYPNGHQWKQPSPV